MDADAATTSLSMETVAVILVICVASRALLGQLQRSFTGERKIGRCGRCCHEKHKADGSDGVDVVGRSDAGTKQKSDPDHAEAWTQFMEGCRLHQDGKLEVGAMPCLWRMIGPAGSG